MYPPSTFGLPRRTPPEGAPILGDFVPGETSVSISAYVAHRDPKVFSEPEEYRPERWLGDDAKDLQAAFISFSTGARGCIGRNISYLEQTVLLASVVHRFEFALPCEVGISSGDSVRDVLADDLGEGRYDTTWVVYRPEYQALGNGAEELVTRKLTLDDALESGVG